MSDPWFNFEYLIQPISLDVFFSQYWEQKPLHISRNNLDYYSGLFSAKDIDTLIQFSKPKYPRVKLGKTNKKGFSLEVLEGMETISVQDYGVPTLQRLYDAYTQDDTLVIYRLEEYWEPLAHFCRALEQYFSCLSNASLFLTPKNAQGFPPHFDPGDMLILQVEGSKVWRIYSSSPDLALQDNDHLSVMRNLPAPVQEIYLEAGDMLYIPRGCVHEVLTTDAPSLHLSIAIIAFTWADLIAKALTSVGKHNSSFHKALPVGFLNKNQPAPSLQAQLTELLAYLSQHANAEEAVSQLARSLIDGMKSLPDGHFTQLQQLDLVNLNSVVAKRQGMVCWIFRQDEMPSHFAGYLQGGDYVSMQFPGNEVRGPSWLEPAYRFIAEAETFAVKELPDSLSDNAKLVLVRRLIREGLLRVVSVNDKEIATEFTNTISDRELALNTK
jgi:ribosomal protein L16 Arg81 hydroxylase